MNAPATNPSQSSLFDLHKNTDARMTSKEIARVTGKEHFHVVRDIKCLIDQGCLCESSFGLTSNDVPMPRGGFRKEPMYTLDFHATLTLVTGYNAMLRSKVIARWIELENENGANIPAPAPSPAPSPSHAQPAYPHQPQPTHLSFNYRESTVEVVLDANRDPHFNVDDVFAALGYANNHGSHQWLRIHAANLRTFPAGLDSQGVDHKYFPLELLYQFLRHSGKIEKFRFIRWLEERVLPDLPKVDFTRPAGLLENLVPVHERTPGACYLLTFDGQQQPTITRLASRENASVTFYDTPGKPNFLTTAYYPIDLMLERVRMDAMASGPDRKSVCVSGLV